MGLKDVFKKIGKVALMAAPYVAAPFTGGASLAATGLANKAVAKWSESDAKKAVAKGLAPSSFDAILNKVGNVASTASMFVPGGGLGAIGKAGSTAAKAGSALANVQKAAAVASPFLGGSYGGPKAATAPDQPEMQLMSNRSNQPRTAANAGSYNTATPSTGRVTGSLGNTAGLFGGSNLPNQGKVNTSFMPSSSKGQGVLDNIMKGVSYLPQAQDRVGSNTGQFGSKQNGGGQSQEQKKEGGYDWKQLLGLIGPAAGAIYGAKQLMNSPEDEAKDRAEINKKALVERQGNIQMKGARALGPSMNMIDQARPNLALSLAQGRLEGMQNQPFRQGYNVKNLLYDPDTEENYNTRSRMPRINPVYSQPQRRQPPPQEEYQDEQPQQNQRRARPRY